MMKRISLLPAHEVIPFFEQNTKLLDNKQKVRLELHSPETVKAVYRLKTDKRKKYTLDLLADYQDIDTFIVANQVQSFREINQVSKAELWMRYLCGNGYVCCEMESLQAELCFRIVKNVTIVYSLRLHFYDEVYRTLSMTALFEEYINNNWEMLHELAEMRREMEVPKVSV